jgi:hypothetical protein
MQSEMTRPIVGIENRTAQEVFDIMCDRFKIALSAAEPWPFEHQNYNCPCIHPSQCDESCVKKPAPSVAVKALEMAKSISDREDFNIRHKGGQDFWPNAAKDLAAAILSAQVQDVAGHEPFGAPGPDAMRVIDPEQWEPCSPDYLRRGGCCASAPRVWNAERLNHYHPKLPAAPAKQEG